MAVAAKPEPAKPAKPAKPQLAEAAKPAGAADAAGAAGAVKTRWGDRAGRRRDILAAARSQMADGGYLALNMRDIAKGAGVSPGTLYSYFATKEEIFATLYAEAIEAHNERIVPVCEAPLDLETLLRELADAYLDLYAAYGRYFTLWSALVVESADDSPLPDELRAALRDATFRQASLVRRALEAAAGREGRTLAEPALALPFLWSVLNGIGDHLTSERRRLSPFSSDELVAYAARTLARGLVADGASRRRRPAARR